MKNFSFDFKNEFTKNLIMCSACVAISVMLSVSVMYPLIKNQVNKDVTAPSLNVSESSNKNIFSDSETVANTAENVSPSVVNITAEVNQNVNALESMQSFYNNDEFFKQFFGFSPFGENMQQPPVQRKTSGTGSGFIISSDGYILTNFHVVKNASKITVKTRDEKNYIAKLVGKDQYSDLAVIKINENGLNPVKLGDSSKIRPGEWAVAVGSPQGLDHTVTLGIISALSRQIPEFSNVSFIQTDAAINPGNSGGPLLNIKGEVIGINTAILGTAQNIGFAIPINVAKKVVNQLKSGETIGHPWIGIVMTPITKELANALGISEKIQGVIIGKVIPGGPADNAGIAEGDIIQRIDGKKYTNPKDIQTYISSKKIGENINIQILRDGNIFGIKIKVGNWQENQ